MDGDRDSYSGEVEWLDDHGGRDVLPGRLNPRRRRWALWLTVAAAVIALVIVRMMQPDGRNEAGPIVRPTSPATSSGPTTALPTTEVTSPASRAVTVVTVGHPLLGITASWELFARSNETLLRIEFARGRITRTVMPGLASNGPVFFVAALHGVIIRPLDFVPGFLVPDGQLPRALTGALASGEVLLPGPRPDEFWISTGQGADSPVSLVGPDGRPIASEPAQRLQIPTTMNSFPATDGAGNLLVTGPGGVYDLRTSGMRRITTGTVLAVGPTRWLAAECTKEDQCSLVVIDQATLARHILGGFAGNPASGSGVISPNGRTAALLVPDKAASGAPALHLIDLSTGGDRRIAIGLSENASDASLAWSPDSTWLFAVDTDGQLHAVQAPSGRAQSLGVPLPQVAQLAIR